jgi:type I restriction enzyme R subunit
MGVRVPLLALFETPNRFERFGVFSFWMAHSTVSSRHPSCSQYVATIRVFRQRRQASFIGFTGTPIEKTVANTRVVFGNYISIYDIQRAVADKATVPIYYESRIAKLALNHAELPKLDDDFEEITEGEEQSSREKLKTKWAALEALVGDSKRLEVVASDLVAHFEKRVEAMDGKAMIVCMSRRVCVALYEALIKLRPDWAGSDDAEADKGKACVVKVVMTGGADDGPEWQPHIRNKERRRKLAIRFKDTHSGDSSP